VDLPVISQFRYKHEVTTDESFFDQLSSRHSNVFQFLFHFHNFNTNTKIGHTKVSSMTTHRCEWSYDNSRVVNYRKSYTAGRRDGWFAGKDVLEEKKMYNKKNTHI
jgi:hypothetical protein